MKPASFDYVKPATIDEALLLLEADPDARLLAGGQSLVPLMNLRLAQPGVLVDINGLEGLDTIERHDQTGLQLGALCRHRQVERSAEVAEHAPLLAEAMSHVGHLAIRNRGTLGGIVAHADPSSEIPAALVALGADIVATSRAGQRRIPAHEFFTGYFSTTLQPHEMVTGVEIPDAPPSRQAFLEMAPRHGDYAIVGVAAWIDLDESRRCRAVRLVACGVDDHPCDLSACASTLVGESALSDGVARALATSIASTVRPTDDVRATAQDRVELTQLLAVSALRRALGGHGEEVAR